MAETIEVGTDWQSVAERDPKDVAAELDKLRNVAREVVAIDPKCGGGNGGGKYFITGDLIVQAREALK